MNEAHVEHTVGLVEDEDREPLEADMALPHEVEEPARCGDEDVEAAGKGCDLRPLVDAAVDDGMTECQVAAVGAKALVDLDGELAGGCEHQGPHEAAPDGRMRCGQAVQDRKREGGRLAGAGLRDADEVSSREEMRDGLRLDGRRPLIVRRSQGTVDRLEEG